MRKPRQPKTPFIPLGIKNRFVTELPALVALTAIGEPWFSTDHQTDLLVIALVVRELAPAESLQAQCAAELQRLCEQPIALENKPEIALHLAECLPWLQLQSNNRIQRAIETVAAKSKTAPGQ